MPSTKASLSSTRRLALLTPNLQSTGRRGLGKGARSGYIFSRYREQDKSNMMHFADKFRIIIAMRLYKYFETRTPNAINYLE